MATFLRLTLLINLNSKSDITYIYILFKPLFFHFSCFSPIVLHSFFQSLFPSPLVLSASNLLASLLLCSALLDFLFFFSSCLFSLLLFPFLVFPCLLLSFIFLFTFFSSLPLSPLFSSFLFPFPLSLSILYLLAEYVTLNIR